MPVSDFRELHAGERVFLLGNGPSIQRTPLELLEDEYTIAMNKIDLVYDETSWRPTYYLNVEQKLRRENAKHSIRNVEMGLTSFISEDKRSFYPDLDTVHFVDCRTIEPSDYLQTARDGTDISDIWSDDVSEVVYRIQSSMYTAVQLASYMGFDEMYLLGCDLYPVFAPFPHQIFESGSDPLEYATGSREFENYKRFLLEDGRPIRSLANGLSYKLLRNDALMDRLYRLCYRLGRVENTHFSAEYNPNMYYQVGDNADLVRMHRTLRAIGEIKGFDVFNATYGGHLEVYERVDMEDVVPSSDRPTGNDFGEDGPQSDDNLEPTAEG